MKNSIKLATVLVATSTLVVTTIPTGVGMADVMSKTPTIEQKENNQGDTKLTQEQIKKIDPYVHIVNNKFVLQVPQNSGLTNNEISAAQNMIDEVNKKAKQDGITIENESMTRKGRKHLYEGANGYLYKYKKGHYHYVVTKGSMEAVTGVMAHGWAQAAGGGWVNGTNKPNNSNK